MFDLLSTVLIEVAVVVLMIFFDKELYVVSKSFVTPNKSTIYLEFYKKNFFERVIFDRLQKEH